MSINQPHIAHRFFKVNPCSFSSPHLFVLTLVFCYYPTQHVKGRWAHKGRMAWLWYGGVAGAPHGYGLNGRSTSSGPERSLGWMKPPGTLLHADNLFVLMGEVACLSGTLKSLLWPLALRAQTWPMDLTDGVSAVLWTLRALRETEKFHLPELFAHTGYISFSPEAPLHVSSQRVYP